MQIIMYRFEVEVCSSQSSPVNSFRCDTGDELYATVESHFDQSQDTDARPEACSESEGCCG